LKQQTYFTSAKAAIWSQKTLISTDFCDQINLVVMLAKDYTQSLAITKSHTHTAKKKIHRNTTCHETWWILHVGME
jgi:hypothetical protein